MGRAESNALMRRLIKQNETLPAGAPFEITSAERFILCDPEYNHVLPVVPGSGLPQPARDLLTSLFVHAAFRGRSFVVRD